MSLAATWASRSPRRSSGVLTLDKIRLKTSAFLLPRDSSLSGGMISPSWKSSVARGIEPGVMPPTSA